MHRRYRGISQRLSVNANRCSEGQEPFFPICRIREVNRAVFPQTDCILRRVTKDAPFAPWALAFSVIITGRPNNVFGAAPETVFRAVPGVQMRVLLSSLTLIGSFSSKSGLYPLVWQCSIEAHALGN